MIPLPCCLPAWVTCFLTLVREGPMSDKEEVRFTTACTTAHGFSPRAWSGDGAAPDWE